MLNARQTVFLTALALLAFAGNSVLARLALVDGAIDAVTFTSVRLMSGGLILAVLMGGKVAVGESWRGATALLTYAGLFSFAYLKLDAGMGALILFAAVQITMIGWGRLSGERLSALQTLGAAMALAGLVWLLLPGAARPDLMSAALMAGSGIGWGIYSILGRSSAAPLRDTADNFAKSGVFVAVGLGLWLAVSQMGAGLERPVVSTYGIFLAVLSGSITSGLGYAIWYRALPRLTAGQAGVVQLLVPPIAALGGVVLLGEVITLRLIIGSLVILAGIGLTFWTPRRSLT